jgi:hypothetical protein
MSWGTNYWGSGNAAEYKTCVDCNRPRYIGEHCKRHHDQHWYLMGLPPIDHFPHRVFLPPHATQSRYQLGCRCIGCSDCHAAQETGRAQYRQANNGVLVVMPGWAGRQVGWGS